MNTHQPDHRSLPQISPLVLYAASAIFFLLFALDVQAQGIGPIPDYKAELRPDVMVYRNAI